MGKETAAVMSGSDSSADSKVTTQGGFSDLDLDPAYDLDPVGGGVDFLGGGAGVGGVVAGLIGMNQTKKANQAASGYRKEAADLFLGMKVPTIEEQKIILQNPQLVGEFTPEQIEYMQLQSSAMENVSADQNTVDAQNETLQSLREMAQGGFTEGDLAVAREGQRMVSRDAEARRQSILNSMATRGVLGSGSELAAQLQGAQQSADQMSSNTNNLVAQAQARKLSALNQVGQQASQMNTQQFNQRSDIAKAKDSINRFNNANSNENSMMNTQARNAANKSNLATRQGLEGIRADNANEAQKHNKGLYQDNFRNKLDLAQRQSEALNSRANDVANKGAQDSKNIGTIIGGVASAAAMFSDKNLKENVSDFDAKSFLEELKAYTYDYKDKNYSQDRHAGVMAQDLEKTPEGSQLVENTPQGKVVDYNKAGPLLLASLVELNERIKKLEGR